MYLCGVTKRRGKPKTFSGCVFSYSLDVGVFLLFPAAVFARAFVFFSTCRRLLNRA